MTGVAEEPYAHAASHRTDQPPARTDAHAPESTDNHLSRQVATAVFAGVLGVALALFLVFGRRQWFFLDDWDFLATRSVGDLNDLLRPHNEHWMTLPVVVYRVLFRIVGLRSYVPYQLVAITLHLVAAALLLVIMRRAGVHVWIATAAASLFALFGAGDQDIAFAFSMSWGASLVFGLVHLLLADHDGSLDRRDMLGLVAGFAGMLCSGVAVTMVFVVGLSTLVRRGWRAALFHTVPLAVLYVAWWLAFARDSYSAAGGSLGPVLRFMWTGLSTTFGELGQVPGVGLLLALVLGFGLSAAWHGLGWAELRRRAAPPGAMLAGAVVFMAIAGLGRASLFGPQVARSSRYLHVVAALCLPALAVAADGLMRRSRVLGSLAFALLLIGLPGNIHHIVDYESRNAFTLGAKDLTLALPRVSFAREVPSQLQPLPAAAPGVTIGWLLAGVSSGRIPAPRDPNQRTRAAAELLLSVSQSSRALERTHCTVLDHPVTRTLAQNQAIRIGGGPIRLSVPDQQYVAASYGPKNGRTLTILRGPLTVTMTSWTPSSHPARVCE